MPYTVDSQAAKQHFSALFTQNKKTIDNICAGEENLANLARLLTQGLKESTYPLATFSETKFQHAFQYGKYADYVNELYEIAKAHVPILMPLFSKAQLAELRKKEAQGKHSIEQILTQGYVSAALLEQFVKIQEIVGVHTISSVMQELSLASKNHYESIVDPALQRKRSLVLPKNMPLAQSSFLLHHADTFAQALCQNDVTQLLALFTHEQLDLQGAGGLFDARLAYNKKLTNNFFDITTVKQIIDSQTQAILKQLFIGDKLRPEILSYIYKPQYIALMALLEQEHTDLQRIVRLAIQHGFIDAIPATFTYLAKYQHAEDAPNSEALDALTKKLYRQVQTEYLPKEDDTFSLASTAHKKTALEKARRFIDSGIRKLRANTDELERVAKVIAHSASGKRPPTEFRSAVRQLSQALQLDSGNMASAVDICRAIVKWHSVYSTYDPSEQVKYIKSHQKLYEPLFNQLKSKRSSLRFIASLYAKCMDEPVLLQYLKSFDAFFTLLDQKDVAQINHYMVNDNHCSDRLNDVTTELALHASFARRLDELGQHAEDAFTFLTKQIDYSANGVFEVNQVLCQAKVSFGVIPEKIRQIKDKHGLITEKCVTELETQFNHARDIDLLFGLNALTFKDNAMKRLVKDLMIKVKSFFSLTDESDIRYLHGRRVSDAIQKNSMFNVTVRTA
jgi:hypothetical protein